MLKTPPHPALLREIAATYGTPTYVYFAEIIQRQIDGLRQHLDGVPHGLLYAMKANAHPAILRLMRDAGLGLDAVSPGELELALALDFPRDRILFSANNMTDDEMHLAQRAGVRLNIGELSRLERYGRAYPGSKVCVRLNPQIGAGHHDHVITAGEKSKFGIPVAEVDAIRSVAAAHGLQIVGLHQHIGSGIPNTDLLWQAIEVLLDAAMAFPEIQFLNVGGGLGIPYRPGEAPLDLDNFAGKIVAPLQRFLAKHPSENLQFWFEPGRYLVAESGVLVIGVNTLKAANGRVFAGTDSGFNHLIRPAMYAAYHALYNLSNEDGPLATYDVVGNICESGDVFARDRAVQEIREGDLLAILDTGAYGMAMVSDYNLRPPPAEVLVTPEGTPHLIRRRRSAQEMVEQLLSELATD